MRKRIMFRSAFSFAVVMAVALGFASCAQEDETNVWFLGTIDMDYSGGMICLDVENNTPVTDSATVRVNGVDFPHSAYGMYFGTVAPLSPGDPVEFSISYGNFSITRSLIAPNPVRVVAPASVPKSSGITVTWATEDGISAPEHVLVRVSATYTNDLGSLNEFVDFSEGSYTLPASLFDPSLDSVQIDIGGVAFDYPSGSGIIADSLLKVANERTVTVNRI